MDQRLRRPRASPNLRRARGTRAGNGTTVSLGESLPCANELGSGTSWVFPTDETPRTSTNDALRSYNSPGRSSADLLLFRKRFCPDPATFARVQQLPRAGFDNLLLLSSRWVAPDCGQFGKSCRLRDVQFDAERRCRYDPQRRWHQRGLRSFGSSSVMQPDDDMLLGTRWPVKVSDESAVTTNLACFTSTTNTASSARRDEAASPSCCSTEAGGWFNPVLCPLRRLAARFRRNHAVARDSAEQMFAAPCDAARDGISPKAQPASVRSIPPAALVLSLQAVLRRSILLRRS